MESFLLQFRVNNWICYSYLTKIADQVVSLIAPRHAKSMVWSEESEDVTVDLEDDQTDRLFTFEVAKTNEQEEGVSARPGFTVSVSIQLTPGHVN